MSDQEIKRSILSAQYFRRRVLFSVLFVFGFTFFGIGTASSLDQVTLSDRDRILILAPHPDDEAIGTGGIIQRAVGAGIPVKVVYLTNGENNELAFLVYKKRPILGSAGLLKMGELRRQESLGAMLSLGLKESQLVFLGYPDFGTSEIFTKYWGETRSFKSILAHVTAVPYPEAFSYRSSFKGESILNDIKKVLLDFEPTKIFVTLPADTNPDHRAYYLFLQVALWDLDGWIASPQIYSYVIHVVGWPVPRGYFPELSLNIPPAFMDAQLIWSSIDLTPQEITKKKEALDFYKSQNAYNPRYLYTFVRKNELFGRFEDISLHESHDNILWEEHVSSQKITSHMAEEGRPDRNIIRSVTYAQKDGKLFIRLLVNRWESQVASINLFLIGYKGGTDFYKMPKLRINIRFDRFVSVFDRLNRVFIKSLNFSHQHNVLMLEVPLSVLGDPEKILSSAKTSIADLPHETTPWRTILIDKHH